MHKPRILLDALAFSPGDGGFSTAVSSLLHACAMLDEFEFLIVHHSDYSTHFGQLPFKGVALRFPKQARFFVSALILPRLVRRVRADAVHCEISAVPPMLGVPASVTVHDLYFLIDPSASGRGIRSRVMQLYWQHYYRASLQRAKVIRAISQTTLADIRRLVSESLSPIVIYPLCDLPASPPTPKHWPADGEPVRLLFLGSIVPRRNLPFLLRAVRRFKGEWRLHIAGRALWGFREAAPMLTDERIRYYGPVSNEERETLLNDSHIVIAPSLYEGFGCPVVEAVSRGGLALTSDVPVFREYVPDECRFDLSAPEKLADLYNRLDESVYDRLRQLSRTRVERFSSVLHRDGYRRLFRTLVGRGD